MKLAVRPNWPMRSEQSSSNKASSDPWRGLDQAASRGAARSRRRRRRLDLSIGYYQNSRSPKNHGPTTPQRWSSHGRHGHRLRVQCILDEFNANYAKVGLGDVHGFPTDGAPQQRSAAFTCSTHKLRRITQLNLAVRETLDRRRAGIDAVAKVQVKIDPSKPHRAQATKCSPNC